MPDVPAPPHPRPVMRPAAHRVHLYAPRPLQAELHAGLKRFSVLVAHRRFGKTVFCVNELIARAAANDRPEPRYGYVAPLLVQAKDIAWTYLKRFTAPIPGVVVRETELWVELPNGARIRLYGADNAERLRGLYFDGLVMDEYAQMSPHVWPEIVRPMLADRRGWALFIGTPMGRNHFHALYEQARRDDAWFAARFPAGVTGVLAADELAAARKAMSPQQFAQEFECSFQAGVPGAYYAAGIAAAEAEGRIGRAPWEPRLPVITAWDLGIGDATAIWFAQVLGGEIRLIDYYEAQGQALAHYVKHLGTLPYVYGEHLLPHDVAVRELGTGTTRLETLRGLGLKARVLKAAALEDGIEAVRALLPRCWFDAQKCARGLDALRLYRPAYDARSNLFSARPLHDWTSHACFTGDTVVLTSHGMQPIMYLPKTGEILTSCGWRQYTNPRITRKNAPLVAVRFIDGVTVKCTPDHLFKTESGWISAAHLMRNTVILSGSTRLHSTSTAASIGFGQASDILREAASHFIEMFGGLLSAKYPKGATYITGTTIPLTICSTILSVCRRAFTSARHGTKMRTRTGRAASAERLEIKRPNGMLRRRESFGTVDTRNAPKAGRSGSALKKIARFAAKCLMPLIEKVGIRRNSALPTARQLRIESVEPLSEVADVWCLSVPGAHEFALENGALVHNCDAFRYLASGLPKPKAVHADTPPLPEYDPMRW